MFSKTLIATLVVVMFVPFFGVQASDGHFTYRSTKMGTGTRQTGQWKYEITNEKYDFSTSESVFALTRIFNITNIHAFQFKYEVRGTTNRDMLSPVYKPNGNWWAEIWYWDEFGRLPAGSYTLRAMISVDNGVFQYLDAKHFAVSGPSYYGNSHDHYDYDYNDYSNSYCNNSGYDFDWVKTGDDVVSTGSYSKKIINQSKIFSTADDVHVLVKNSHITGVDTFKIKFVVYLNGNRYYKTNEVPTLNPNCQPWAYNYSWADLGPLPEGNHEIRTYIKLNNGSYKLLDTERVIIKDRKTVNDSHSYREIPERHYHYTYGWTQTDTNVDFYGDYRYGVSTPRDVFSSQEDVKVLTRLSDIKNIKTFKVRHELHKNGYFLKKIESAERRPNMRDWKYNYTESNFGKLSAGNYEIKVYLSINGKAWRLLDVKQIGVSGNPYLSDNYKYDWTMTGTNFNNGYYY